MAIGVACGGIYCLIKKTGGEGDWGFGEPGEVWEWKGAHLGTK